MAWILPPATTPSRNQLTPMATRPRTSAAVRRQVTTDAGDRCSYCRSPSFAGVPMVIDHIIPIILGGSSKIANLCLACYRCNEFKGARIAGIDPITQDMASLFHPRQQLWQAHFRWHSDGLLIIPLTARGRATVATLRMNNDWLQRARRIWMVAGIHPPLE
mgnify:CR=1 FL=1